MKLAAKKGKIAVPPPPLSIADGELPPIEDAQGPEWRDLAVFVVEELASLLECEDIEPASRVFYATAFCTGTRFSELIKVRVRDYDQHRKPLGCLVVPAAKVARHRRKGRPFRRIPVHPDLRAWLSWWLREHYEVVHGHKPRPDDLLFPTLSDFRRKRGFEHASHSEVYHRWERWHLPAAELRHRRLHDGRRTFISLTRAAAEGSDDLLRKLTHKASFDRVLDDYTSYQWRELCGAVSQVEWQLPNPPGAEAVVIALPRGKQRLAPPQRA